MAKSNEDKGAKGIVPALGPGPKEWQTLLKASYNLLSRGAREIPEPETKQYTFFKRRIITKGSHMVTKT